LAILHDAGQHPGSLTALPPLTPMIAGTRGGPRPEQAGDQPQFTPCMYGRTHVYFGVLLKRFPGIMFFSRVTVWYKSLYLIVRTSVSHHATCQGGQPMGTWVLADLENIIGDFMEQLESATEKGWHRTKPDHYRSILAALESALEQRCELLVSRDSVCCDRAVSSTTGPRLTLPAWPNALRWMFVRPLLCLVPSRGQ
jgi:hypothetical protein